MNARTFSLTAKNSSWATVSTYDFSKIGSSGNNARICTPNGMGGFEQSLTVQEGDVIDYIVKQTVKKADISLSMAFAGSDPISAADGFRSWCESYVDAGNYRTTFCISYGATNRYVDVVVKKFSPEQMKSGVVKATLTLQPISLFYSNDSNQIILSITTSAKAYPYGYPRAYGGGSYGNSNQIVNTFMKRIPLIVTFHGHISAPQASLIKNGETYSTIRFLGLDLAAGCSVRVDAVNGSVTYIDADGNETDYYNEIDKTQDTFLYAEPGVSTLSPNLDQTDTTKPSVEVRVVKYGL